MTVNVFQAALLGLFACLASMPGLGGTSVGNYTLGRPLVAGLIVGIILGDVALGIIVGAAIQVVYIALVTPGGTVSADVRAACYIGIPLAMMAVSAQTSVRLVEKGRPLLGMGRMVFHEPREDDPSEPPSSVLFPMTKRADMRLA